MWTMDELVERVRVALSAEYPGAPNGRVRDLPDRRAIRWYATIGLVDRPATMRGRVALYSSRHLVQVVALKRLQAQGRSLAEIQAELAGASDATLAAVARIPDDLLDDPSAPAAAQAVAADVPTSASAPGPGGALPVGGVALRGGAILVLPVLPEPGDYADIAAAAAPLLDLLAARGLLTTGHPSPTATADDGSAR